MPARKYWLICGLVRDDPLDPFSSIVSVVLDRPWRGHDVEYTYQGNVRGVAIFQRSE